jgi:hypothetical protein
MTDHETVHKAVMEAMGWEWVPDELIGDKAQWSGGVEQHRQNFWRHPNGVDVDYAPMLTHSLIHEAQKLLTDEEWIKYATELYMKSPEFHQMAWEDFRWYRLRSRSDAGGVLAESERQGGAEMIEELEDIVVEAGKRAREQ